MEQRNARRVRTGWRWGIVALATTTLVVGIARGQQPARPQPHDAASEAERRAAWQRHLELEKSSEFRGLEWRSVGPVVQGGRVVDIESVPGSPYTFYVAYASGGLWKTTNNGVTFEPLFDRQRTIIMGDVAVDPSEPQQIWVGTGESNSSRSSYDGCGVFHSTDGGKTWQHRGLDATHRIGRVLVDPRDSKRVYVAALGKLYTPGGQRGVYRTSDSGDSWQCVLDTGAVGGAIDLVMHPNHPEVMYVATWERSRRPWNFVEGGDGSGIWKTTDGGDTWRRLQGGFPRGPHVGRIGLSICTSQPNTIYACLDNQQMLPENEWELGDEAVSVKRLRNMTKAEFLKQDPAAIEAFVRQNDFHVSMTAERLTEMVRKDEITIAAIIERLSDANAGLFNTDIKGLQVWRSDDDGEHWRLTHDRPLDAVVHTYGYYFGQVRVAPNDPERVYVLGVPLIGSTDGGKTFSAFNQPGVHSDNHELWIDPIHPQRIFLGNDGGLDMSYDGGKTWVKIDQQAVGQFYTIELDDAKPYNIYGGLQDNGTLKGSSRHRIGFGEWQSLYGGDGMYVQVDPRDGTTYLGYQFGFYGRLGTGGYQEVRPRTTIDKPRLRYNWSTPVLLSSHNPDIVYFGSNIVFRSMDRGETWTAISPDLSTSPNRGDIPFATVTTLAESRIEFGLLWAGTDDGNVYVTEDGGKHWQNVAGTLPRDRWVTRVQASRYQRERAYVTLNGYRDDDITAYVYVTEDLGRTWRSIATGLPAEAVNVIIEDPVNADVLYVGTDRGVYVSLDRGGSWQSLPAALPNVPVHDLKVHWRDRELVAATHGRSVWVIDALPIQELTNERRREAVFVFPLESQTYVDRGRPSRWYDESVFDSKLDVTFWSRAAGHGRLDVIDGEDHILRTIEITDGAAGVRTVTWDLLVDAELAFAAEDARIAKLDADDPDRETTLAERPWHEEKRLGRPLGALADDYTIRITIGGDSAETTFTIDPAPKPEPRQKPKPPIRGRKK